jgi:hypothetical protein
MGQSLIAEFPPVAAPPGDHSPNWAWVQIAAWPGGAGSLLISVSIPHPGRQTAEVQNDQLRIISFMIYFSTS